MERTAKQVQESAPFQRFERLASSSLRRIWETRNAWQSASDRGKSRISPGSEITSSPRSGGAQSEKSFDGLLALLGRRGFLSGIQLLF